MGVVLAFEAAEAFATGPLGPSVRCFAAFPEFVAPKSLRPKAAAHHELDRQPSESDLSPKVQ
jgi:hypothetical protein